MSRRDLFCAVDDFWQQFAVNWQQTLVTSGQRKRLRASPMYPSERMTMLILFHQSHSRTFKAYDRICPAASARGVSHEGSLAALCRVDAHRSGSTRDLSAHPVGPL